MSQTRLDEVFLKAKAILGKALTKGIAPFIKSRIVILSLPLIYKAVHFESCVRNLGVHGN